MVQYGPFNNTSKMRVYRCRSFTPEEDKLIIAQSQGTMSLHKLEKAIGTGRDTLSRRAKELGVRLRIMHRARRRPISSDPMSIAPSAPGEEELITLEREPNSANVRPVFNDTGANPYRNEPDKLLERLLEIHSDRRYEALTITKRER